MLVRALLLASEAAASMSCTRTTTTSTTWVAEGNWTRPGTVESVREVVRRVEGQPVAGALAGALIGGILFHGDGPATLFGAATGAAIGAAASQGSAETRTFQVLVRFDDGERGMFVFRDYSPFPPGARVVLTPQGLGAGP
jgi:outer membrane lipoprotein SlyB